MGNNRSSLSRSHTLQSSTAGSLTHTYLPPYHLDSSDDVLGDSNGDSNDSSDVGVGGDSNSDDDDGHTGNVDRGPAAAILCDDPKAEVQYLAETKGRKKSTVINVHRQPGFATIRKVIQRLDLRVAVYMTARDVREYDMNGEHGLLADDDVEEEDEVGDVNDPSLDSDDHGGGNTQTGGADGGTTTDEADEGGECGEGDKDTVVHMHECKRCGVEYNLALGASKSKACSQLVKALDRFLDPSDSNGLVDHAMIKADYIEAHGESEYRALGQETSAAMVCHAWCRQPLANLCLLTKDGSAPDPAFDGDAQVPLPALCGLKEGHGG